MSFPPLGVRLIQCSSRCVGTTSMGVSMPMTAMTVRVTMFTMVVHNKSRDNIQSKTDSAHLFEITDQYWFLLRVV